MAVIAGTESEWCVPGFSWAQASAAGDDGVAWTAGGLEPAGALPASAASSVAAVTHTLRALAAGSAWADSSDAVVAGVLGQVAEVSLALDALRIRLAGVVAQRSEGLGSAIGRPTADSLAVRLGARHTKALLSQAFGVPVDVAAGWIDVAAATVQRQGFSAGSLAPQRPQLAAGLQAGEVSAAQALAIHRGLPVVVGPEAPDGMLEFAEASLVAQASGGRVVPEHGPGVGCTEGLDLARDAWGGRRLEAFNLRKLAARWSEALDPDGVEPDYEKQVRSRCFRLTPAPGGGFKLTGFAPDLEAATIKTVLDAYTSPRRALHEATAERETVGQLGVDGRGVDGRDAGSAPHDAAAAAGRDERSDDQKSFDVLAALFSAHARSPRAPSRHGAAPTLLVTTTLEAIERYLADRALPPCPGGPGEDGGAGSRGGPSLDRFIRRGVPPSAATPSTSPGGSGVSSEPEDPFDALRHGWGQGWESFSVRESTAIPEPLDANHAAPVPASRRPARVQSLSVCQDPWPVDPDALSDRRFARLACTGSVVPLPEVLALLCESSIQLMTTSQDGVPLQLGRARRHFSPGQRRVLIARDRTCRAPGCGAPPDWCEAHHVVPWSEDGGTNVDHGILLCGFHHRRVHAGALMIEARQAGRTPWLVRAVGLA